MALRDPNMHEFSHIVFTEQSATDYARQNNLLLSDNQFQQIQQQNDEKCLLGTVGCNGTAYPGKKRGFDGFRCRKCKRFRTAKNAVIDGEIRGPRVRISGGPIELRSFFATVSKHGRR